MTRRLLLSGLVALSSLAPACYYYVDFNEKAIFACDDNWNGTGLTACAPVYRCEISANGTPECAYVPLPQW